MDTWENCSDIWINEPVVEVKNTIKAFGKKLLAESWVMIG